MSQCRDVTLFDDQIVHVNLELGRHKLVKGYRGEFGLPAEAFTRLYAVADGRIVAQVAGPVDLSRLVEAVRTLTQALTFVDLFTALSTHFLFPDFRHSIEISVLTPSARSRPGAVTPAAFAEWRLEGAMARETAQAFTVERNLAVLEGEAVEVRRVVEEVQRDGSYRELTSTLVRRTAPSEVIFPSYE